MIDLDNLQTKEYGCSLNGAKPVKITEKYINMYIQLNGCNANCRFCEFKTNGITNFDLEGLRNSLKELKKRLRINKISITGGEPTLNIKLLGDIIKVVKEVSPESFLVINTNGYNLLKLSDEQIKQFGSISISRHHYDDKRNDNIFKTKTLSKNVLEQLVKKYKNIIHFSCNLIKEEIDTDEEILKYLDFIGEIGGYDVGFVGLMPINKYAKEHFIPINLDRFENDRFVNTREYKYFNFCHCKNFLYITNNKKIVKVYSRRVIKQNKDDFIVYNGKELKNKF